MDGVLTGRLARLNERVTLWLARIGAVVLGLIASVTFCDVIARKVFSKGFTFTVEMTEMAMALIVFLGVGLVTHQRGHIVVDLVTLRLSERSRVWLGLVTNVLSLGFVLLVVWRPSCCRKETRRRSGTSRCGRSPTWSPPAASSSSPDWRCSWPT
jgi:TRAP-type mannitol/chloroaromatic compound transport system permease small subunit